MIAVLARRGVLGRALALLERAGALKSLFGGNVHTVRPDINRKQHNHERNA
jgi:hypothetical protein